MTKVRASLIDKGLQPSPTSSPEGKLKLEHVITALPLFNQQELKVIQAAIDTELIKYIAIDTDLYYLVFEVVGEKPLPISKFTSSNNGTKWRKNEPVFKELIDKIKGRVEVRKPVILALNRLLIQLIVDDIKEQGLLLNLKTVCEFLGKAEAVFDRAYPDYLRSGLGHIILAKLGGINV